MRSLASIGEQNAGVSAWQLPHTCSVEVGRGREKQSHPNSLKVRILSPCFAHLQWPDLVKHHDRVMGLENVAAYLQSPQRLAPIKLKYV